MHTQYWLRGGIQASKSLFFDSLKSNCANIQKMRRIVNVSNI